jgi:predicted ATPase/class 3 adenylate cyclase
MFGSNSEKAPSSAPTGTVTFLFSDIEGSTKRWDHHREAMQAALRHHDELLHGAVESNGGHVFKTVGDEFCSVFSRAHEAVNAAVAAQHAIGAEDWSAVEGLRVRMAIHTGVTDERDGDYYGGTVNRVARLLSIGHGGQVLLSGVAQGLVHDRLPSQASLIDMGLHRLKDLSAPEQVFQLRAPGLLESFPPLKSLDAFPNNLPAQLTPLLGRDEEVAAVAQLVRQSRVVTLLGSGGIGKTRTALQVAADLVQDDGSWFVNLASIDDPANVPSAIAGVFNIADEGGSQALVDRIVAALRMKSLLIVLDNCEHVVVAAAHAIDRLVQGCPKMRILATSREALGIAGESLYRMPLLAVPPDNGAITADRVVQYPAAALFVARAKATQQNFTVTDQNAPALAQIVRRLDGIALAIELAASRVKVLNLQQLAQRLDDQLKLLTGGSRNVLPRQQTVRALIAWSYDLLDDGERSMLRQAAIFRGSWTLEAAEAVWQDQSDSGSDALDLVTALADKSLLVVEEAIGGEQRYRLLESTRAFAQERLEELGEADSAGRRHCEYYAAFAEEVGAQFWSSDTDAWIGRVRLDLDNFRRAIRFGLSGADTEVAVSTVAALRWYWDQVAVREGRELVGEAQRALAQAGRARTRALLSLSVAMLWAERRAEGATAALSMFSEAGSDLFRAEALGALASARGDEADFAGAIQALEEALVLARAANLQRLAAMLLSSLGYWQACAGNAEAAIAALEAAMPAIRRSNDLRLLARSQAIGAELAFASGDVEKALASAREAEAIYRERSNEGTMFCATLGNLAAYLIAAGEIAEARRYACEALDLAAKREDTYYSAICIGHLARIAAETRAPAEAARLLGFVDAACARLGSVREPTEKKSYDRTVELIRAALPEDRIVALMKEGAAMDQETAIVEALAIPQPAERPSE